MANTLYGYILNGEIDKFRDRIEQVTIDKLMKPLINYRNLFHVICMYGDLEMFKIAIKHAESLNIPFEQIISIKSDVWEETPLHIATEFNKIDICKFLIDHNVNVNEKCKLSYHETSLLIACQYDNMEMCQLLLSYGADPTINESQIFQCINVTRNEDIKQLLNGNGSTTKATTC